jgi:hypothetical protein
MDTISEGTPNRRKMKKNGLGSVFRIFEQGGRVLYNNENMHFLHACNFGFFSDKRKSTLCYFLFFDFSRKNTFLSPTRRASAMPNGRMDQRSRETAANLIASGHSLTSAATMVGYSRNCVKANVNQMEDPTPAETRPVGRPRDITGNPQLIAAVEACHAALETRFGNTIEIDRKLITKQLIDRF